MHRYPTGAVRRAALAAVLLAGTTLSGTAFGIPPSPAAVAPDQGAPVNPSGGSLPAHALPDFSALVTQVKPAVVSITTRFKATPAVMEGLPSNLPFPFNQMIPQFRGGE